MTLPEPQFHREREKIIPARIFKPAAAFLAHANSFTAEELSH